MGNGLSMPRFWQRNPGWIGRLLSLILLPFGLLYASIVYCRLAMTARQAEGPVIICVGNVVVGGAGKTPVCLGLGRHALDRGLNVHYLSRGFGGSEQGPVLVDPDRHDAATVGDEALLLAAVAPTWVAKDRAQGARRAAENGAELIIMDDGLQNPSVRKTYTLVVVNGAFGFGNGLPMPAGPLREFRRCAFARSDRCMVIGAADDALLEETGSGLPVSRAEMRPEDSLSHISNRKLLAFSGIGQPEKFFTMLRAAGLDLCDTKSYPDHHTYSEEELAALRQSAEQNGAILVTTTKDYARLSAGQRQGIETVSADLHFPDGSGWQEILDEALARG